jgi:type I restriction enzyme R subunit
VAAETPDVLAAARYAGSGWLASDPKDYDRTHALDVPQLFSFLHATRPDTVQKLVIASYQDSKEISRQKFLARLSSEIGKRGVIDVLRKGLEHGPLHFDLFYGTPSPGNAKAALPSMRGIVSASRANCATAWTNRAGHWTCA